jgi:hypothetical protein
MAAVATERIFKNIAFKTSVLGLGLRAKYSPVENVPSQQDHKRIVDPFSPQRAALLDWYSRRPHDRLSWCVITDVNVKTIPKAVLRNRLRRRWASAFTEALTKNGYYHNGRKRSGPNKRNKYVVGLKGTLEIFAMGERGLFAPRTDLVRVCDDLVKELIRNIKNGKVESRIRHGKADEHVRSQDDTESSSSSSSLWSLWQKLK